MIVDLAHLKRIRLSSRPLFQRFLASFYLWPNYKLARVRIDVEGLDNLPMDETVILAMNHTDRFNAWPIQVAMYQDGRFPFTSVWVKGKYYRNPILGHILDACNLIPAPNMRYYVRLFFKNRAGRSIREDEYRMVRDIIDEKPVADAELAAAAPEVRGLLAEGFAEDLRRYHQQVMDEVARLSIDALTEKRLNLLIFPEGTRSRTMTEGRSGMAQLAVHTLKTIVPIGCNYSERIYPDSLPIARPGRALYRIGKPLTFADALRDCSVDAPFKLFSPESRVKYDAVFDTVTRRVMAAIANLVDPIYVGEEPATP